MSGEKLPGLGCRLCGAAEAELFVVTCSERTSLGRCCPRCEGLLVGVLRMLVRWAQGFGARERGHA